MDVCSAHFQRLEKADCALEGEKPLCMESFLKLQVRHQAEPLHRPPHLADEEPSWKVSPGSMGWTGLLTGGPGSRGQGSFLITLAKADFIRDLW